MQRSCKRYFQKCDMKHGVAGPQTHSSALAKELSPRTFPNYLTHTGLLLGTE